MLQEEDALEEGNEARTPRTGKTEDGDHGQSTRKRTSTKGK